MKKNEKTDKKEIPTILSLLFWPDVLFPGMKGVIKLNQPGSINVIKETKKGGFIGVIRPSFQVGTVAKVISATYHPSKSNARETQVNVVGIRRFKIIKMQTLTNPMAEIELLSDQIEIPPDKSAGLLKALKEAYKNFLNVINFPGREQMKISLENTMNGNLEFIINFIIGSLPQEHVSIEEKQKFLELIDPEQRIEEAIRILYDVASRIEAKQKLAPQTKEAIIKNQIEMLRKQLGEDGSEIEKYQKKIIEAQMPPEVEKKVREELKRLSHLPEDALERGYLETWLDWMTSLPWQKCTEDKLDIKEAEKILEEDHYGLEQVKRRILEFLAVRKLGGGKKGPILYFIGPPGTGKTSVGKSIARAMGRKFVRISLGGIYDEAQIRGHHRTDIGALPGVIIAEIKKAGVKNPVFMIDEIDKIGTNMVHGDPFSALLEALDPEQNNAFSDHYLSVPFDLSEVMFICTGNYLDIPPALLDRMEIIEFASYTSEEKLVIAERYLVPRQIKANGLSLDQIKFKKSALQTIIKNYTAEAGVRNLEKEIGRICRHIATKITRGEEVPAKIITEKKLPKILGAPKYLPQLKERISQPGLAIGLFWTPIGGQIIFIEVVKVEETEPGLVITGNVGNILEESARIALTFVEANLERLKINPKHAPSKSTIHVHIPEGAIEKDGPSAGITIFTALVSLLRKKKVRDDVAMTGEITLRGKILPVGGIKEKIVAAKEAGVKTVIIPKDNEGDLRELPPSVKEAIARGEIEIKPISEMLQVLETALKK